MGSWIVNFRGQASEALTRQSQEASEAAKLWAALRSGLNDLARVYGVAPLGV